MYLVPRSTRLSLEYIKDVKEIAISCTLTVHFGALFFKKPLNSLLKSSSGGRRFCMEIHAYFKQNCAVIEVCAAPWPCAPQQPAPPALHLRGRARRHCARPPQPQLKPLEFIVFPYFPLMCGIRLAVHAPSIFVSHSGYFAVPFQGSSCVPWMPPKEVLVKECKTPRRR